MHQPNAGQPSISHYGHPLPPIPAGHTGNNGLHGLPPAPPLIRMNYSDERPPVPARPKIEEQISRPFSAQGISYQNVQTSPFPVPPPPPPLPPHFAHTGQPGSFGPRPINHSGGHSLGVYPTNGYPGHGYNTQHHHDVTATLHKRLSHINLNAPDTQYDNQIWQSESSEQALAQAQARQREEEDNKRREREREEEDKRRREREREEEDKRRREREREEEEARARHQREQEEIARYQQELERLKREQEAAKAELARQEQAAKEEREKLELEKKLRIQWEEEERARRAEWERQERERVERERALWLAEEMERTERMRREIEDQKLAEIENLKEQMEITKREEEQKRLTETDRAEAERLKRQEEEERRVRELEDKKRKVQEDRDAAMALQLAESDQQQAQNTSLSDDLAATAQPNETRVGSLPRYEETPTAHTATPSSSSSSSIPQISQNTPPPHPSPRPRPHAHTVSSSSADYQHQGSSGYPTRPPVNTNNLPTSPPESHGPYGHPSPSMHMSAVSPGRHQMGPPNPNDNINTANRYSTHPGHAAFPNAGMGGPPFRNHFFPNHEMEGPSSSPGPNNSGNPPPGARLGRQAVSVGGGNPNRLPTNQPSHNHALSHQQQPQPQPQPQPSAAHPTAHHQPNPSFPTPSFPVPSAVPANTSSAHPGHSNHPTHPNPPQHSAQPSFGLTSSPGAGSSSQAAAEPTNSGYPPNSVPNRRLSEPLSGIIHGFGRPIVRPQDLPSPAPVPEVIVMEPEPAPPYYIVSHTWKHLIRFIASQNETRIEPSPAALAREKSGPPNLRVVLHFVKLPIGDWRIICYFAVQSITPPPDNYPVNDTSVVPYLFPPPEPNRPLVNLPETQIYTVLTLPLPILPLAMPNLAPYLQTALDEATRTGDSRQRLVKLVNISNAAASGPAPSMMAPVKAVFGGSSPASSSSSGRPEQEERPHMQKVEMKHGGNFLKRLIRPKTSSHSQGLNNDTYDIVTPFKMEYK